jgi:phage terminase small subunit
MAGNRNSGRPRTPAAKLKLHGTFRADRHGARAQAPAVGGLPEKPKGLKSTAAWLWELVISEYSEKGILARLDTPALWSMCEMWGLYRTAVEAATKQPADRDMRLAAVSYKQSFDAAAARFGLNPSDRSKLQSPAGDGPKSTGIPSRKRA